MSAVMRTRLDDADPLSVTPAMRLAAIGSFAELFTVAGTPHLLVFAYEAGVLGRLCREELAARGMDTSGHFVQPNYLGAAHVGT